MGIVIGDLYYTVKHAKSNGQNATEITVQDKRGNQKSQIKIFSGDGKYDVNDKIKISGDAYLNKEFILGLLNELNGKNNHNDLKDKKLDNPSDARTTFRSVDVDGDGSPSTEITFGTLLKELNGESATQRNNANKAKEYLEGAGNPALDDAASIEARRKIVNELDAIFNTDTDELATIITENINENNIMAYLNALKKGEQSLFDRIVDASTNWIGEDETQMCKMFDHLYAKLQSRAQKIGYTVPRTLVSDYVNANNAVDSDGGIARGATEEFQKIADALEKIAAAIKTKEDEILSGS